MADVNIDAISLQIESDSSKAEQSLNNLAASLTNLKKSLSGLSSGVKNLNALSTALGNISKTNVGTTIDAIATSLSRLNGIDTRSGGLNALANTLARISRTEFDPRKVTAFADSIQRLGNVRNLDQITGGMTRLVNATNRLGQTQLQLGGSGADLGTTMMSAMAGMPDFAALAASANSAKKSIAGVSDVSSAFKKASSEVNAIIKTLATGFVNMGKAIGTAYLKLGQLVGSGITNGLNSLVSRLKGLTSLSGGIKTLSTNFKTLLATMLGFRGIMSIFNWTKSMISLGSEVTEVDHIVESVFGENMVGYVDDWANNAIEKFGIAAVEAKKYAGRLSAMFQASNVGAKQAGEMGMRLTELAGDLSAFYNIDTDTAFKKVQSGMAGMVRPLRDLGIDLTAATLQEYALSQGIEKSYSSMTQAEKVMLRYQYLMNATKTQQGDFERTSQSLANSMRTFKAYAQAVTTQLGVGLGAAIRHVVVWMNGLMKVILKATQAFATFMQTLFGKYKGGASGIALDSGEIGDAAESAGDLSDSAGSAADGLDDASDSAKKLKKDLSVLPFDELNQLNKDVEQASSGSGGAGGAGGGVGGLDGFDLDDTWMNDAVNMFDTSKLPDAISRWAERIKSAFEDEDWQRLGKVLSEGLNKGINKIYDLLDPSKVQPKIKKFTDAFTKTFNSLVDNLQFNKMGRTVGRGINNLVYFINQTIEGINWKNLGSQFSRGFNGLLYEVDWDQVGRAFANRLNILWHTLEGSVGSLDWAKLGNSFADGVSGLTERIDYNSIARTLSNGLAGIATAVREFAENFPWARNGMLLASGVNNFIKHFPDKEIAAAISKTVNGMVDGFNALTDPQRGINFKELGTKLGDLFRETINTVDYQELGNLLSNIWNDAWAMLKGFVKSLGDKEGKGTGIGKAIQETLSTAIKKVKVEDMSDAIRTLVKKVMEDIATIFGDTESMTKLGNDIGTVINDFFSDDSMMSSAAQAINSVADGILAIFKGALSNINMGEVASGIGDFIKEIDWKDIVTIAGPVIVAKAALGVGHLGFGAIKNAISAKMATALTGVTPSLTMVAAGITAVALAMGVVESTKSDFENASKEVQDLSKQATDSANQIKNIKSSINDALYDSASDTMVKKTILSPYLEDLSRLSKKTGDLTEKEQALVDQAFAAIIREYPNLAETLKQHKGDLQGVVDTVEAYMASVIESAKADAYYEKMREAAGVLIDAEETLRQANEKQKQTQEELNTTREQAVELAKQLGDSRVDEIDSLENINQKVGLAQTLAQEYYGTQVQLNGETVSYGEAIEMLTGKIADLNTDANVNNETIKTSKNTVTEAKDAVNGLAESYTNLTSGEGSVASATETIGANTEVVSSNTEEINKNKEANEGMNEAANKTPSLFDLVKTAISGFASKLLNTFPSKESVTNKAENIPEGAKAGIENKQEDAFAAATSLGAGLLAAFATALAIESPSKEFSDKAEFIPEGVAQGVENKKDVASDAMTSLIEAMDQAAELALDQFGQNLYTLGGEAITEGLQKGIEDALNTYNLPSVFDQAFSDITDTLSGYDSTFYDIGQSLMENINSGLSSIDLQLPKIDVAWDTYTYGNGGWFELPRFNLEWYAKGGLFTKATIAGFGEAGNEAALPLENKRVMNMIASAIVDNSNGAMGMDEQTMASAVTRGMIQAMMSGADSAQRPVYNIEVRTENNEVLARAVLDGLDSIDYRNSATPKIATF